MDFPYRKPTRLKSYDYSFSGGYFITICTADKKKLLSEIIVGEGVLDLPQNSLTGYGKIAEKYICQMNDFYDYICVDKYVIMPNHIHLILRVENNESYIGRSGTPSPTMSGRANSVIPRFVSAFKRFCNGEYKTNIWQRSFHDHVIRGQEDYEKIWKYIDENPARWNQDCFYVK